MQAVNVNEFDEMKLLEGLTRTQSYRLFSCATVYLLPVHSELCTVNSAQFIGIALYRPPPLLLNVLNLLTLTTSALLLVPTEIY